MKRRLRGYADLVEHVGDGGPGDDGDGYPDVGETLGGHYSIGRRIGSGGMGWVFEALDTRLARQVAVKVIAPQLAADPGFRDRFAREAAAQASLDSPHVVQVHDHGEEDGRLYLVTQLVPDGDLGAMLEAHGAPSHRTAVDVVGQVASGLADVHAAGLVHRDVKPSNVLLRHRDDGIAAYLGDFGVVRRADGDPTGTGAGTLGTPRYMAPELHAGAGASPRTDVYSLGCLLWTTLTGRAPYDGGSEWEIVTAHREQPVPQLPGRGALEEGLNRVLARALAKDPAERYADAAAVRDDLRRLLALPEEGYVAPVTAVDPPPRRPLPPPPASRAKLVALAIALLVVVAVAVAVWALTWGGQDPSDEAVGADQTAAGRAAEGATVPARSVAEQTAVDSLARALEEQGVVDPAAATCAAERWIAEAGLEAMVAAGFFDEDLAYVDQPRSRLSSDMREAIRTAVEACVAR